MSSFGASFVHDLLFDHQIHLFIFIGVSGPVLFNIGDVRTRHTNNLNVENTKPFFGDPEDPSAAALKVRFINLANASRSKFELIICLIFRNRGTRKSDKFVIHHRMGI